MFVHLFVSKEFAFTICTYISKLKPNKNNIRKPFKIGFFFRKSNWIFHKNLIWF